MNPWKIIDNNYFHLTYKFKEIIIKFIWIRKIYSITFNITELQDDTVPHHRGIHYNLNQKQIDRLTEEDRRRELARREAVRKTVGVRSHVG